MPDNTTDLSTKLDSLRTEHEVARLRFETQQLERATKPPLMEAWGDLVVKPRGFDDQTPSTFVPDSKIYDRTDGKFLPVYETEQDLARIRGQARHLITLTSVRTGALELLANYTFGTATQFKAQAVSTGDEPSAEQKRLAEAVQQFVDQFVDINNFTGGDEAIDRETNRRSREDGEAFLYLADAPDGIPRVRFVEPDQVTQPANPRPLEDHYGFGHFASCWKFGVHTPVGQTDQVLGFHVVYDGVGNDWDYIPVSRMQHVKRNVTRNAKRGVSDFYEVLADLVNESRLRGSMLSGATAQAAIAWIMKPPTGSTHAQVSSLMNAASNSLYSYEKQTAGGGSATQYVKQYKGNTFLGVAPGQEYAEMPGSNRNAGFQIVGQYALRAIGTRWCIPEYMISGDATTGSYANFMVAESPFVKGRESDQGFHRRHFLELIWKALRIAYDAGWFDRLGAAWPEIYSGVDITCDMPAVATRDTLKLVQTQEVQIRLGILSERTAATQAGLDIDAERKEGAKPAAASPFGFADSPQVGGMPGADVEQQATPIEQPQIAEQPVVPDKPDAPAESALNGAQITAAIDVLNAVVAGTTAELVAVELMVALGIDEATAKRMVAASKKLRTEAAPPSPVPQAAAVDKPPQAKSALQAAIEAQLGRMTDAEILEAIRPESLADGVEIGEDAETISESLTENCGTGAGGFQAGNECAAGGGGVATAVHDSPRKPFGDQMPKGNRLIAGDKVFSKKDFKLAKIDVNSVVPTEEIEFPGKVETFRKIAASRKSIPPIVIDYDGNVADGHHRLEAVKRAGLTHIWALIPKDTLGESALQECGGPGSGIPGPCPTGRAERMRTGRKLKWSGAVALKRGEKASISVELAGGDRDSKEYHLAVTSADGKSMGSATLNVVRDKRGRHFANLHPTVAPEFRRRGVATKMYLLGAKVAGKHGAVLTATDSLSDSAYKVWDKLEDRGKSKKWSIDRRRVMSTESIEAAINSCGQLLESWSLPDHLFSIGHVEQAAESLAETEEIGDSANDDPVQSTDEVLFHDAEPAAKLDGVNPTLQAAVEGALESVQSTEEARAILLDASIREATRRRPHIVEAPRPPAPPIVNVVVPRPLIKTTQIKRDERGLIVETIQTEQET